MRPILAATAGIAAMACLPLSALAGTITENFSVPVPTTEGGLILEFPGGDFNQCDPASGFLTSIDLTLTGSVTVTASRAEAVSGVLLMSGTLLASSASTLITSRDPVAVPVDITGTISGGLLAGFIGNGTAFLDYAYLGADGHIVSSDSPLTGTVTYNFTDVVRAPEPASIALLSIGVVGAWAARRRKKLFNQPGDLPEGICAPD
jgi:hypothetical protein